MLEYNYNLLRKDLTDTSNQVKDKEQVKKLVTDSAMMCDTPQEDCVFTWKELTEVIDKVKLDNKKVYRDLTKSGPIFHNAILNFFNKCYREETIPDEWSETELMKLYKNKGKRTDLKMNRFIHLKPFMPKTFEKLLMKKIEKKTSRNLIVHFIYQPYLNVNSKYANVVCEYHARLSEKYLNSPEEILL